MSEMLTQLTISVQGKKGSGKTMLAKQLAEVIKLLGGTVVANREEKGGDYLTVSLPMGTLEPSEKPKFLSASLIPDNAVWTLGKLYLPDMAPRALFPVGETLRAEVFDLVGRRKFVTSIINSTDPVGQNLVQMLDFMDREALITLVKTDALAEAKRIDAQLAKLGFRYEPQA